MGFFSALAGASGIAESLISGYFDNEASRRANNTQRAATEAAVSQQQQALAEQRRQYDQTREDFEPWRGAGVNALTQLQGEMNAPVTGADVMQDPGYQFGLDQGVQALNRRIAAMGGRVSGAAIKAGTRYAQDYATGQFNAAYQRRQDRLNRLAALAQVGQTATGSSAAAGAGFANASSNAANAIGGLLSGQGDATAASQLARGNIWGNTASGILASLRRPQQAQSSVFRANDPYRNPGYYGGEEGE